jgi:hypothetical protein
MRAYADKITAHAAGLETFDAQAAREWADWIRQHAERTDPLNGPLRPAKVTLATGWREATGTAAALDASPRKHRTRQLT